MQNFVRKHQPGQGEGYKPPMDPTIFRWLALNTTALIVVTAILAYTVIRVWG